MAITFLKEENLFHLHNDKFSFYVKIHKDGAVLCPYFGKYLSKFDFDSYGYMCDDWYAYYFDKKTQKETKHDNLWENSTEFLVPSDKYADARPSLISVRGVSNDKLEFTYV